jgi:hypothetical protein
VIDSIESPFSIHTKINKPDPISENILPSIETLASETL